MKNNLASINGSFGFLFFLFCLFAKSVSTQAQDLGKKMSPKEIQLLIDSLSNALNRTYIYPEKARLMANNLKSNFKKGQYTTAKNKTELADQLQRDVQLAHPDKHFHIEYSPAQAKQLETVLADGQIKAEYEQRLKFAREDNFSFKKTEVFPGNIGYVRWDQFPEFTEEIKPTLNSAFLFVSNCNALIIDLRYNGGGSISMVLQMQNYFFKERTHLNDIIFRGRDTIKKWSNPAATDFKLEMPVYILTSGFTFSGAEDFTYGMQHTKRAIVIGESSGGGSHPINQFSLSQGFVATIPIGCAAEGEDWEGTGIKPDITAPAEQALTKAKFAAFSEGIDHAANGMEKMKFTWQLNNLKANENIQKVDTTILKKYTGNYSGGFNFYIGDGNLYCKNARRGNLVSKLKLIDEDLFVIDENIQVKFEKDNTGTYTHLQELWSDGWTNVNWKESYYPQEPKVIDVSGSVLQKYAGVYSALKNTFTSIVKKEDGYYMYIGGSYFKMYFTTETDFFHKEINQQKFFKTDASGNVIGYDRYANGNFLSYHKKILNVDTLTGDVKFFHSIGWSFIDNKDYNQAEVYLKRGLQLYPGDLLLESNLAHCYLFTGEYAKALEVYKKYSSQLVSLNYSWETMICSDFDFFRTNKYPLEVIQRATDELKLNDFIARKKKEKEKKMEEWIRNLKRSETAKISDACTLVSYTGTYEGGLDFYIKDGHLFCRNKEVENKHFELKYIDTNLFILDENAQVEFIKDSNGIYSKIKLYMKDGTLNEKVKI